MRLAIVALSLLLVADSVLAAAPDGEEVAAAREHFNRGRKLFDLGKYDQAIAEYQQAYEIRDDPVLLFNIAQAYRLSSRYAEALRFYRLYLRRSPKAANRVEVRRRIFDMEDIIARQTKAVTSPPTDTMPMKPEPLPPLPSPPMVVTPGVPASASLKVEPRAPLPTPTPAPSVEPATPSLATERSGEAAPRPAEPELSAASSVTAPAPFAARSATQGAEGTREGLLLDDSAHDLAQRRGQAKVIGGSVMVVLGVGLVAGGLVSGLIARDKARQQEDSSVFLPDAQSMGQTLTTLGIVFDVVGVALAASGLAVAIIGARQKAAALSAVTPVVGPHLVGANLRWQF